MLATSSISEKEQIRSRVPLEDLIRDYNVQLLPSGRGFKALCPFHSEKTPSFHVNVERQTYTCFGCEERGDVFSFVQKFEHVDFPQALELLAQRAGVELSRSFRGARRRQPGEPTAAELYNALQFACDYYHQALLTSPLAQGARDYLASRGIETHSWETFKLGFSPAEGSSLISAAKKRQIEAELLEASGLAGRRRGEQRAGRGFYDYFRGRLMFPISNTQGRTVGFGARTLDGDVRKYVNTPKTPIFDKSRLLYGLAQARTDIQQGKRIALCEGYTDVIMAHQAGLKYFVASLGTAFTEENALQVSRLSPRVWLLFDGDNAGQKAAERSLDLLLPHDLDVNVYTVPGGQDPCDSIAERGGVEFQRLLDDDAVGLFEFKWRRAFAMAAEAVDGEPGPAARSKALDDCLRLLARVRNVVRQQLLLREFAERMRLDEGVVVDRFRQITRANARSGQNYTVNQVVDSQVSQSGPGGRSTGADELARIILECLLALPHNAAQMWTEVPTDLFQSESLTELVELITRQLQEGELSPERLIREAESAEAQSELIRILNLIEPNVDQPQTDYSERWQCVLGDIRRFSASRELESIDRQLDDAQRSGDDERRRVLMKARIEALRELKKQ